MKEQAPSKQAKEKRPVGEKACRAGEMGKSKDGGKRAVECRKKLPPTEEER